MAFRQLLHATRLLTKAFLIAGLLATWVAPSAKALNIFWANQSSGAIGAANLDGTDANQSFITSPNNGLGAGVSVDGTNVYFIVDGNIARANLDGTGVNQSFITGADSPNLLALDGTHMYWANGATNTIARANLDGTDVNLRSDQILWT